MFSVCLDAPTNSFSLSVIETGEGLCFLPSAGMLWEKKQIQPSPQSDSTQTSANTLTNFLALMQNYSIKSRCVHTEPPSIVCLLHSKPHVRSTTISPFFPQRCLHREMVREMGLMGSNSILRQIHISQQLMGLIDWAASSFPLCFTAKEDLYQEE